MVAGMSKKGTRVLLDVWGKTPKACNGPTPAQWDAYIEDCLTGNSCEPGIIRWTEGGHEYHSRVTAKARSGLIVFGPPEPIRVRRSVMVKRLGKTDEFELRGQVEAEDS
jgi:hypothetical protein